MIFPYLSGLLHPIRAPLTYFLLAINLFVFVVTLEDFERADAEIDLLVSGQAFLDVQGKAFAVMITREPRKFSRLLIALAGKSSDGDRESQQILGSLALRNHEFMSRAKSFDFGGDELALAKWRLRFAELQELESRHPSYHWGLSRSKGDWIQFISYQFAHSGWAHLFWNMMFLLIFGAFIETQLGSSFVVLTYVGSGVAGAVLFAQLSGFSSAPLVGASAAVSGLMALVGAAWIGKEKLRFWFWLLPVNGYFGFIALPSWLVLFITILPDLSGYLGGPPEAGSVAFSAHLGGAVFGSLIAGIFRLGWLRVDIDPPPPAGPELRARG